MEIDVIRQTQTISPFLSDRVTYDHFKSTVLVLLYENNNIMRVCKINWPINQLIITNTATMESGQQNLFPIIN